MSLPNKKKIRIGVIGPCPPPHGGVTRLIMNNLHYWKDAEVEVFFIPHRIPDNPQPPEGATFIDYRKIEGVNNIPFKKIAMYYRHFPFMRIKNYIQFYQYNSSLAKIIKEHQINLLYAHHAGVTGLSAILQSDILNIPSVVVSYGETWLIGKAHRRFKRMAKFILGRASWILSTSEHCLKGALNLGADPKRSSVVYAGIDLKVFRPNLDGNSYRKKIGVPLNGVVVSILGLALRQKVDTFLEALNLLGVGNQVYFLVGGVGEDFDYLKEKVEKLGMNRVKLLGFVSEEDLPSFYASTDILVASPKTIVECMGQSIKEAMACGKTPVVANIGGGPEAVSNMENGLLFEPGNSQALADALHLLINGSSWKRVGKNGSIKAGNYC